MRAGSADRSRILAPVVIAILATTAVGLVVLLAPEHRASAIHIFVPLLAALVVVAFVRALAAATSPPGPLPFDQAWPVTRPAPPLPELRKLDQLLDSSTVRGIAFHHQLRPRLQMLARDRLSRHHGVSLEDVDAARRLLGEETWALVRPDLEPPEDRFGAGIPPEKLQRVVAALEGL
jgi:hypothetical protein